MTDTIEARWEAHNEAGRRYFSQGDFANAEQAFVAAIREATALGDENVRLASSLSNLGQLKYKQKDLPQAEALFRRALAIRETVLGAEHFGLVQNLNNLAALHYARGELEQAEPLFRRALTISEQALGETHPDVAVTLNNLARLYFRRNDFKAAAPLLLRLLTIKQEGLGTSHPEVAAILASLARVRFAEGEYDAGEQLARRALAIREQIHVPGDPAIATALETLGEICGARGKHDEEMELRQRALTIREGAMGSEHPAVVAARASLELRRVSVETAAMGETSGEFVKQDGPRASGETSVRAEPEEPARSPAIEHEVSAPPALELAPLIELRAPRAAAAPRAPAPPVAAAPPRAAPPAVAPAAPRAPSRTSGPSVPPRTTKSKSLPWIEPPTSPLVTHRPTPPDEPARPAAPPARVEREPVAATPAATSQARRSGAVSEAPDEVEPPKKKQKTPADAYENLMKHGASDDSHDGARAESHEAYRGPERREVSLEDWSVPERRSWPKVAAAILLIGGAAAGGWYFFGRQATASSVGRTGSDASPAAVTTPVTNAALGNVPDTASAARKAPPRSAPPERAARTTAAADQQPAPAPPEEDPAIPTSRRAVGSALPAVNVDRITQAIADSARARVDSAQRALNVNPPTFKSANTANPPR